MYGKLFAQMYDGTLATKGPWQALVTFQQMIILCDKQGVIDMTAESIARRTTIPLEVIQLGLDALEQPDAQSRTPTLEGRRIVRLSDERAWGWQIVNYAHYRAMRSHEERKEYMRNYQRDRRAGVNKDVNKDVNKLTDGQQSNLSSKQNAVSRKEEKPAAAPRTRKTPLPKDFPISPAVREWASKHGHIQLEKHHAWFMITCAAKGYQYVDWDAAFKKAIAGNWAKVEAPAGSEDRKPDKYDLANREFEQRYGKPKGLPA